MPPEPRTITIDNANRLLTITESGLSRDIPLFGKEAFELISREWVRIGWSLRYYHTFTWLGLPILQLPEDLVRMQEVVYAVKPDLIIETGVFDGGSLLFYAGLFETIGNGRIVGIDIEIRPSAREGLGKHHLAHRIELLEGDSTAPEIVSAVKGRVRPGEKVLVILDSNHTRRHVAAELEAYSGLVTPGSCIVAMDGIMRDLADVPGGDPRWAFDNPSQAAIAFAAKYPEFSLHPPAWRTNISDLEKNITYWPNAWLWRK